MHILQKDSKSNMPNPDFQKFYKGLQKLPNGGCLLKPCTNHFPKLKPQ